MLAHKRERTVHLGDHVTLLFEDELTIRYQIQEMLRIEKMFEEAGIQDELDAYNPLVPDGSNFKATMLIEYEDVDERARRACAAQGHRGSRLGAGRRIPDGASRSPTRTSSARTTRRPRPCTSCASSSRRRWSRRSRRGARGDGRGPSELPRRDRSASRRRARGAARRISRRLDPVGSIPAAPAFPDRGMHL